MENLSHEELYEKAMVARDKSSFNGDEGDYYARKYKEYKQEILSRLNRLAEAERENKELKEKLSENHDWYCGCDHWNGANLATCAMCGRTPNESYPTT